MSTKSIRGILIALAPVAGAAWLAAQTASTARPTPQPTSPAPETALTPGSASTAPGQATTPGHRNDLNAIPDATPVGMPTYSTTPIVGASAPTGRPVSASDCAGNAWQNFGLGFQSQKNCEAWVAKHPVGRGTPRAGASASGGAAAATPQHPRTPRSTVRATPHASVTPLPNPPPAEHGRAYGDAAAR